MIRCVDLETGWQWFHPRGRGPRHSPCSSVDVRTEQLIRSNVTRSEGIRAHPAAGAIGRDEFAGLGDRVDPAEEVVGGLRFLRGVV